MNCKKAGPQARTVQMLYFLVRRKQKSIPHRVNYLWPNHRILSCPKSDVGMGSFAYPVSLILDLKVTLIIRL